MYGTIVEDVKDILAELRLGRSRSSLGSQNFKPSQTAWDMNIVSFNLRSKEM
jgi:hypothetical protein